MKPFRFVAIALLVLPFAAIAQNAPPAGDAANPSVQKAAHSADQEVQPAMAQDEGPLPTIMRARAAASAGTPSTTSVKRIVGNDIATPAVDVSAGTFGASVNTNGVGNYIFPGAVSIGGGPIQSNSMLAVGGGFLSPTQYNPLLVMANRSSSGTGWVWGVESLASQFGTTPMTTLVGGYFQANRSNDLMGTVGTGLVKYNYGLMVGQNSTANWGTNATYNVGLQIDNQSDPNGINNYAIRYGEETDATPPPFVVLANGYVGVKNPAPAYPIDVTGNIHATGTIFGGNVIAQYQDVAEWVPATETMSPGTVVVLNLDKNNEVTPSSHAYDPAVAGVVSAQPGVLLGMAAASKAQIATSGRVRVKVDATKQPIKVGDLLVTSDHSGFAMKSIPLDLGGVAIHRPGTLIGKALEPMPSGEGEILVLLSLQ